MSEREDAEQQTRSGRAAVRLVSNMAEALFESVRNQLFKERDEKIECVQSPNFIPSLVSEVVFADG